MTMILSSFQYTFSVQSSEEWQDCASVH